MSLKSHAGDVAKETIGSLLATGIIAVVGYVWTKRSGAAKAETLSSYLSADHAMTLPLWVWLLITGVVISLGFSALLRAVLRRKTANTLKTFVDVPQSGTEKPTPVLSEEAIKILAAMAKYPEEGIPRTAFRFGDDAPLTLRVSVAIDELKEEDLIEQWGDGQLMLTKKGRKHVVREPLG